MEVWAGIRKSSSRKYLQDPRIRFIELDFARPDKLTKQLDVHKQMYGGWDCIIHCAGVTKCLRKEEFDQGNHIYTRHLVEALQATGMIPRQFVYLSSLSVFGPIHETDYAPICETDIPAPDTVYGVSKLNAEQFLQSVNGFPWVIFRPTGVYGPRERDYFLMAKSIRRHVDFAVGIKRQDLTFVYVKDLVQAIYLAVEQGTTHRAYFVSDGAIYASRTFSDLIRKELGNPWVLRIKCPLFILKIVSLFADFTARCTGKAGTLNRDKFYIMKQRNWQCDLSPLVDELEYRPVYPLERGVKETMDWYKKEGWI